MDENEELDLLVVPLESAVEMVVEGKINANSTAHLILRVARILEAEGASKN